jgi:hypothetical protein
MRLNTFRVFGDDFVYCKQPYIRHIVHIRLITFRVNSPDMQKELRIGRKKFSLPTLLGNFKGTVFRKNQKGSYILA